MFTFLVTLGKRHWLSWLCFIGIGILVWSFRQWCYKSGVDDANQYWSLKWAMRDAADNAANAKREAREREEEQRRLNIWNEEQKHADEILKKARSDVDNAVRAGNGLRQQLANLERKLSESDTRHVPTFTNSCATNGEVISMLTQLLRESDDMAGQYAADADRAYYAGQSCERLYKKIATQ